MLTLPSIAGDHLAAVQRWLSGNALWARAVAFLTKEDVPTYLVGGSVRDALRGVTGGDLDIAVDGGAIRLGRRLADELGGTYYVMDSGHDVGRVILGRDDDDRSHIDLAGLRGSTIQDDLCARDLTVNAMGMALTDPLGVLLDPTGGLDDLSRGIIRQAYANAFVDDPLRMLRAVRMSAGLGFVMDDATRDAIVAQRPLLRRVSAERLRDELMLLLEQPSVSGLELALDMGLLADILAPVSEEQLGRGVQLLDALRGSVAAGDPLVSRLATSWLERFVPERSRGHMVSLAAVLAYGDSDARDGAGRGLRLSSGENTHVGQVMRAWWCALESPGASVTPLAAHRYYREYGAAGADGAALALVTPRAPQAVRAVAAGLLNTWFDDQDRIVAPVPMLTGGELIDELGMEPGPEIGAVLRSLVEAQVQGIVSDREAACAWLRDAWDGKKNKGKQV
ncbi:MAG: hypothetical protein R6X16_16360 [Anaerolineae bacterium]